MRGIAENLGEGFSGRYCVGRRFSFCCQPVWLSACGSCSVSVFVGGICSALGQSVWCVSQEVSMVEGLDVGHYDAVWCCRFLSGLCCDAVDSVKDVII